MKRYWKSCAGIFIETDEHVTKYKYVNDDIYLATLTYEQARTIIKNWNEISEDDLFLEMI